MKLYKTHILMLFLFQQTQKINLFILESYNFKMIQHTIMMSSSNTYKFFPKVYEVLLILLILLLIR